MAPRRPCAQIQAPVTAIDVLVDLARQSAGEHFEAQAPAGIDRCRALLDGASPR
jgi:hypothetical protein